MSLASLIRAGRRGVKNARLGVLGDYLRRLRSAIGNDEQMAKEFGTSVPAIDAAIKSAKGHLTWFDPEHASPVAVGTKDGSVPTWTGQRLSKAEGSEALAEGSILDFECIATTARRDRDGDVLEPKGAIVDPKLPLLWQHMPFSPIGRMTTLLDQDEKRVAMRCCVLDTLLGRDAAVLIKGGALRISHGFAPIEYNPLKDDAGKDMGGWRISKYAMMEVSVVSIPSNVDAEITAFSGGKLHHPIVKGWCETLFRNRTKTVTSGFDPSSGKLELTINLNGLDLKAVGGKGKKAGGTGGAQDDDEEEDDKNAPDGGKTWTCEGCGKGNAADAAECAGCGMAKPKSADEDEEEEEEEEDKAGGDEGEDGADSESGGKGMTLGEIRDAISGLAKSGSLPKEAQRRLAVAEGMLEDVDTAFESHGGEIAKALKDRDLAGVFGHCSAMYEATCSGLRGVAEELDRIAGVQGLDEAAVGSIAEVGKSAMQIADAVSTMAGLGGGDEADSDTEDDEVPVLTAEADGEEGEEDEEDEEEKESDEDYSDEEEDEDDSEIDEEEDEDDKAGDDEDDEDDEFEEKDESFGENPEADLTDEQDEDNPGVAPKGAGRGEAKQKTGAASLATRLSGELIGGATLDAETRQLLAGLLGDPADR